ncbi:MAG: hypothetical protein U5K37_09060 [Natrialbaceae archaeon]|nr:hypothetical protein [Natrialbaceae archaeon]
MERGDGVVNLLEDATPRPNFDVDVTADQTVTEGETVSVQGTVENTGDAAGTQDVTLSIADQSTTESISLAAGESTTVSLSWATEPGDAGTYSASIASANDTASTDVIVEEPPEPAFFDVELDATSPVSEGDTVVVDATTTNTGDQTGTQDVTVAIAGQSTTESVTLDAGQTETVTLERATASGDAGNYTATAQTANDTAERDVEVTEQLQPASFTVDVATNSPVEAGDTLVVDGTVTNIGQASATKDVTLSVADQSTTQAVSLAGGNATTVTLEWATAAGDAGNYTATVSSPDDSASAAVTVNQVADQTENFSAYVAGEEGYLNTGTDQNASPIAFTECSDFAPTQDELNATPDYLPAPECITLSGEINHETNTWQGDVEFPTTVMEQEHDILGDLYVEASIATDAEGISGTWNEDTGVITANMTVNIDVAIYDVTHGDQFANLTSSDRVTDETCHIPDVSLNPSTENSYQTASSYPDTATITGERLANDEAFLVSNNFPVSGAADCGSLGGFVDLNNAINDELGTPADPGDSEVAFDVVFDFEE